MEEHNTSAKQLTEMSIERGYLAKQLYAIFTTPINGMDAVMQNLPYHLAFQEELERDGIMFAAGPRNLDLRGDYYWSGHRRRCPDQESPF